MSVAINLFTEKTELYDILITGVFSYLQIAILQNDFIDIPYTFFHTYTMIALIFILIFFFHMPTKSWPTYVKKNDSIMKPKRLFLGIYFLIGISCMLTLFGNAVSETVPHGVFVFSISIGVSGLIVFLLWKVFGISPLRCGKVLIAIGALGFLTAVAGSLNIVFLYISCALIGMGNLAASLSSYYGIFLMKRYPSKMITPVVIILAVITIILHSSLLESYRDNVEVLYILYAILAIATAVTYLLIEPLLMWSIRQNETVENKDTAGNTTPNDISSISKSAIEDRYISKAFTLADLDIILSKHTTESISGQELRIAEFILNGFTSGEIAIELKITENTVKGYRKNLYAKLNIHSFRELFLLANSEKK